jgi:hypothetical protein
MTTNELNRKTLTIMRAALLAGVLLLGAAVWWVLRGGERPPLDDARESALRLFFTVLAVATAPGIIAVRFAQGRAPGFARKAQLAIVGWALGEGVALLGGVIYMLTGSPRLYLLGVLVLLAAFALVPIPRDPDPYDPSLSVP